MRDVKTNNKIQLFGSRIIFNDKIDHLINTACELFIQYFCKMATKVLVCIFTR